MNPYSSFRLNKLLKNVGSLRCQTRDVGVCALHWPTGYPTVTAPGGKKRPRNPPSDFELPDSCLQQTTPAAPREIERRMLDSESRARNHLRTLEEADKIRAWSDLKRFCKKLEGIIVREFDSSLELISLDGFPPEGNIFHYHSN